MHFFQVYFKTPYVDINQHVPLIFAFQARISKHHMLILIVIFYVFYKDRALYFKTPYVDINRHHLMILRTC